MIDYETLARRARTVRYHAHSEAVRHLQTVADHTFHVMLLLRALAPGARPEVLLAAMTHDMGEDFDAPGPWKRANPAIAAQIEISESKNRREAFGFDPMEGLTDQEIWLVDFCDRLESVLFLWRVFPREFENFVSWCKVRDLRVEWNRLGRFKFTDDIEELPGPLRALAEIMRAHPEHEKPISGAKSG